LHVAALVFLAADFPRGILELEVGGDDRAAGDVETPYRPAP
jgi:hypothetical protein